MSFGLDAFGDVHHRLGVGADPNLQDALQRNFFQGQAGLDKIQRAFGSSQIQGFNGCLHYEDTLQKQLLSGMRGHGEASNLSHTDLKHSRAST